MELNVPRRSLISFYFILFHLGDDVTFELRQLRQEAGREVEKGKGGWVSGEGGGRGGYSSRDL